MGLGDVGFGRRGRLLATTVIVPRCGLEEGAILGCVRSVVWCAEEVLGFEERFGFVETCEEVKVFIEVERLKIYRLAIVDLWLNNCWYTQSEY